MPSMIRDYPAGTEVEVNLGYSWYRGVVKYGCREFVSIRTEQSGTYSFYEEHRGLIRLFKSPKPREHSFKNWMDKLEGKNNDHIFETKSTRLGFGKGVDLLHEFLQRHIRFRDYHSRIGSLDLTERQALDRERQRLGVVYPTTDSMGLYSGDRSNYQHSVEYLTSNQTSEQQSTVQEPPTTTGRGVSSDIIRRYINEPALDWDHLWSTSVTYDTSRSG